MKENRYISGLKVLLSAAFVLSTLGESYSVSSGFIRSIANLRRSMLLSSNINKDYNRELIRLPTAIMLGLREIIDSLVYGGADVNEINSQELYSEPDEIGQKVFTPLLLAIMSKREDIAGFLIRRGADVNRGDCIMMYTPLHFIVQSCKAYDKDSQRWSKNMIEFLMFSGANPNAIAGDGLTPLLLAVKLGKKAMVKCLINFGADVNYRRSLNGAWFPYKAELYGTPLHYAIEYGYENIAEILKARGGLLLD
ncbi:MAG: ankyrin repeat domain-containing protein [Holosporaceae bacterium]|jgi:ankyrin repeat protein|nr:ankyrin repeat domain-containing protein [Holosporaceae bacterium]